MPTFFRPGILFLCLLAAGCVSTTDKFLPPDTDSQQLWQQQQRANNAISSWELKGKIGVRTGKKGGSATLNWSYKADNQFLELYGPFGGGRVHINSTPGLAVLEDTKGRVIEGTSAQDVLYQRLGWHVPFAELVMWSRGLPNEGATEIKIDSSGRLKSLKQGIWFVEYQEYREVNNLVLPRKLVITSLPGKMEIYDDDGNYIGDELSVKVILKRWWNINAG